MTEKLVKLERAADAASRRSDEWTAANTGRRLTAKDWLNAMLLEEEARDAWRELAMAYSAAKKSRGLVMEAMRTADLHDALADAASEQINRLENPKGRKMATRKPTAAQLAARERFAAMARAGAFKRGGKRKANPLTRVKVNSPSMATGEAPTKRLKQRRRDTVKAPTGYYANPIEFFDLPKGSTQKRGGFGVVMIVNGRQKPYAWFKDKAKAMEYAQAKADQTGFQFGVKQLTKS